MNGSGISGLVSDLLVKIHSPLCRNLWLNICIDFQITTINIQNGESAVFLKQGNGVHNQFIKSV